MTSYLVYVQGMSGTIGPQIWHDPPPGGYRDINVVGTMLPIPPHIQRHVHHVIKMVERLMLRHA